jgi:hypothetical protein
MQISGTRSHIIVQFDHRSVKITGELTTTPVFYADIISIKNWEPPYESVAITEKEKEEIIKRVTEETKDKEVKIVFD